MASLQEGEKAPKFLLHDKDGVSYGIGKKGFDYTVLFFYPKDSTPGCTVEAQEFSQNLKHFLSRKISVVGISGGDQKSKEKFCQKYSLGVPLVSDTDFAVSRAYGVFGEKKFMGRVFKGIHRKTFIVDKSGRIARVFDSVRPLGHAQEVLKAIDELRGASKPRKSGVANASPSKKRSAAKRGRVGR